MHHYDTTERRQAVLLQFMLIGLIVGAVVWLPISLSAFSATEARLLAIGSSAAVEAFTCAALLYLRRGHINLAVLLGATGIFLAVTLVLLATGLSESGGLLFVFTLPLTLAGLRLGWRGLLFFSGLCLVVVGGIAFLEYRLPTMTGYGSLDDPITVVGTFALALALLVVFVNSFGASLRAALTAALAREQELQQVRASLEDVVVHRTSELQERSASLQAALAAVEQREAHLSQALEDLRASQETVQALSAPVIPVLGDVLVAPLIGVLDSTRAAALAQEVLAAVERRRARHIVFDVTGVPVIDTQVAQALLQTSAAIRLLGADVSLVGIRPEVAQTIVMLGIDLGMFATYTDLQGAIIALLKRPQSAASSRQVGSF